jgi:hypothetical protein
VPLRVISSLVIVAALAVGAATAEGAAPRLKAPGLVHQGAKATFRVPVSKSGACSLTIRYATGAVQQAGRRSPRNHAVTWVVAVPGEAAVGIAHWTVFCGSRVPLGGTFIVVHTRSTTPGGATAAPKIVIDKQGYTQRPDKFGPGSLLSYGLMLRNTSATEDAKSVYVLVNMVAATGELLGSESRTVTIIGSVATFAYGDSLSLRTQVAVTRLEITIRVGAHEPKTAHPAPDFANVRPEPAQFDPGWVGEVDGEVLNATPTLTLSNAQLSIVVFDVAGNVIGGGTGATSGAVPSGSRIVFVAQAGFTALPIDKAATAIVSAEPTYTNGI